MILFPITTIFCANAWAQSLNIDFGSSANPKPSASYGGGALQPGYWNGVPVSGNQDLFGLDGVTAIGRINTNFSTGFAEIPGSTGGDEALMESFLVGNSNSSITVRNLAAGQYNLVLYGWAPFTGAADGVTDFNVGLSGSGSGVYRLDYKTTVWPGQHVLNETFLSIPITLTPDAVTGNTLLIISLMPAGDQVDIFQGMQLVMVPAPGAAGIAMLAGCWAVRRRR